MSVRLVERWSVGVQSAHSQTRKFLVRTPNRGNHTQPTRHNASMTEQASEDLLEEGQLPISPKIQKVQADGKSQYLMEVRGPRANLVCTFQIRFRMGNNIKKVSTQISQRLSESTNDLLLAPATGGSEAARSANPGDPRTPDLDLTNRPAPTTPDFERTPQASPKQSAPDTTGTASGKGNGTESRGKTAVAQPPEPTDGGGSTGGVSGGGARAASRAPAVVPQPTGGGGSTGGASGKGAGAAGQDLTVAAPPPKKVVASKPSQSKCLYRVFFNLNAELNGIQNGPSLQRTHS